MVVCRASVVAFLVRQLQFNMLMRPTVLMQNGRRHATETLTSHAPLVAHGIAYKIVLLLIDFS